MTDDNEDNFNKLNSDNFEKKKAAFIGTIKDLPERLRDNEYLLTGYRINYTGFCVVLKTMFKCHNETFNIWSHFLGKLVALLLAFFIIFGNPLHVTESITDYNYHSLIKVDS